MLDGRWVEVRNPLQEGVAITAQAADMLFYELPHYRPDRVQIDVYTDYRDADGRTRRELHPDDARPPRAGARGRLGGVDAPTRSSDAFGGRYRLSETGRPLPIEPLDAAVDAPETTGRDRRWPPRR